MQPHFLPTAIEHAPSKSPAGLDTQRRLALAARHVRMGVFTAAALLTVLALVELAEPSAPVLPDLAAAQVIVHAAFLLLNGLWLLAKLASWMQRASAAKAPALTDPGTSLLNMTGLAAHGNDLLAASRRDGKSLAVAVFDCSDLLEVRAIYGNAVCAGLRARLLKMLTLIAGRRGLVARTGPAQFAIVLPGHDCERALRMIQRVLGTPSRIEYDGADSEIVLVPEFLIESLDADAVSVQAVCRSLGLELTRQQEARVRREESMQRARERHSRSMTVPVPAPDRMRRLSRSIPVPMANEFPTPDVVIT